MAHEPRARSEAKPRTRADGVTIAPAPGARKTLMWLAAAGALAAVALLALFAESSSEGPSAAAAPREPRAVRLDPPVEPASQPGVHPVRIRGGTSSAVAEAPPPRPPHPDLPVPGPSGIGLYPPRGTDPVKLGIVVPEGFELPEGYVRHYQVTDDGQPLPPILMFHPDYDWVDESGAHVEPPEGGIVPPELAPPGMPIQMLELPDPPSEP